MAGNHQQQRAAGGPVKVSVVGGGQRGSKVWRRERIDMTEADLDDVAFLSGIFSFFNSVYFTIYAYIAYNWTHNKKPKIQNIFFISL